MGNYLEISKIENLLQEYRISEKLNDLTSKIKINATYNIFPDETREGILNLKNSELKSFDSNKFFDNVSASECFLELQF